MELRDSRCVSAGERYYENQGERDGLERHLTLMCLPTTNREWIAFKKGEDNNNVDLSEVHLGKQLKRKKDKD